MWKQPHSQSVRGPAMMHASRYGDKLLTALTDLLGAAKAVLTGEFIAVKA